MLKEIINKFDLNRFTRFFREKNRTFTPSQKELIHYDDENFRSGLKLGEIKFTDDEEMIICAFEVTQPLTERSGKKAQYEKAKKILKETQYDSGIFIFYDQNGNFRFSLIYANYLGRKRDWSNFRRFTYFVCKEFTNKTFLLRIGEGDFSSLEKIKDAFSVEKVTKQFYKDISYWYFWAIQNTKFPKDAENEKNGRNIAIIRLITRLIFIWFMRERKLIPGNLFDYHKIKQILIDISPIKTTYYKAILQNLFFATLNTKERKYRFQISGWKNSSYMDHSVYRYQDYFTNSSEALILFKDIPFLNGGLFDCLDRPSKQNNNQGEVRIDGFSDKDVGLKFPNFLFFSEVTNADLNKDFGTKNKNYKVQGLINILSAYNFTIDENDPNDQEVALDPELLGKVFENLLASFNPETSSTARKATGSYYTPREIVNYMVTQSLKEYFKTHLKDIEELDKKLDELFATDNENNPFTTQETKIIVKLIDALRIVDPAVGSGAFPMGILNKLVFILAKLDPENELWKQTQINALEQSIPDPVIKRKLTEQIEKHFKEKNPDYGRKLHLIQKCIYGVDIQQTAVEIAKLRFFISLLVDEKIDKEKKNWGIEPLPNLDFKIMQGNSLISEFMGTNFDDNTNRANSLFEKEIDVLIIEFQQKKSEFQNEPDKQRKDKLKKGVEDLIIQIFENKLHKQKSYYFNQLNNIENKYSALPNEKHRNEMIAKERHDLYKKTGFDLEEVEKQLREFTGGNKIKPFFLWKLYFAEVFQGDTPGFDIVIANPPYGLLNKRQNKTFSHIASPEQMVHYKNYTEYKPAQGGMINVFRLFIVKSISLLSKNGVFSEIFPLAFVGDVSSSNLRVYLLKNCGILNIEAFPERDNEKKRVFEAVKMSVCILNLHRRKMNDKFFIRTHWDRYVDLKNKKVFMTINEIRILDISNYTIPLINENDMDLLLRIYNKSIRISDIGHCFTGEIDLTQGRLFITDNPNDSVLIKGAIIDRFLVRKSMSQGEIEYLNANSYLKNNKSKRSSHHNEDRIVMQAITGVNEKIRLKMMIIDKGIFCSNSVNYIILSSMQFKNKYILGVLNSTLLNYVFSKSSTNSNVNGYEVDNLPIPNISYEQQLPIIKIVDQILALTQSEDYLNNPGIQAKVKELEKEIDKLVYELYGLTDEEIRIVEGL